MISGTMQAKCGTRCPVTYIFEKDKAEVIEVKKLSSDAEPQRKTAKEASDWICDHMKTLAEKIGGAGFSDKEIMVRITGPNCSWATVVDLPGEKPDEKDEQNEYIRNMIAAYCAKSHVVPLIVIALEKLDVEFTMTDFKRLLRTMKSGQAIQKALVLVNHLDRLVKEANPERLQNALLSEITQLGIVKSRICFMSLKPHLFDPQVLKDTEKDTNAQDFNFDEQDLYFKKFAELDKQMTEHLAKDPATGGFNVGLQKLQEMLAYTQVTYLQDRIVPVTREIEERGRKFRQQVKEIDAFDEEKVREAMTDYVKLMGDLAAAVIKGITGN